MQVLPPELLEKENTIEVKENLFWKPSSLKDGESEEFRLLGCYETGHAITGWQYASEKPEANGELKFAGYVVTKTHPGTPDDLARETDWSSPERPKIDGTFVKPRKFLAWVATSAARGRMEVLFIEQKGLREQLAEVLQEVEDFTWTDEGLANFSLKFSRKGQGMDTKYTVLPKVRAVSEKIKKAWADDQTKIWLPNMFEGEDPFEGKKVDAKGLPAGGTDKNGAHVSPKTKAKPIEEEADF